MAQQDGVDPAAEAVADDRPVDIDMDAWADLLMGMVVERGVTPRQLADALGLHRHAVTHWLRRKHRASVANVRDSCRVLGYPVRKALVQVGFLTSEEAYGDSAPEPTPGPHGLVMEIGQLLVKPGMSNAARKLLEERLEQALEEWSETVGVPRPGA
ncbi:helix-turn-helix transcriptional regulator [Longispora sp. NPDC051575]|uniref:helix-turn-helix domain-containing protein n=1 Tax=Longispora sp. NPDC051575 TaxID=3154943 RepID=UPI003429E682